MIENKCLILFCCVHFAATNSISFSYCRHTFVDLKFTNDTTHEMYKQKTMKIDNQSDYETAKINLTPKNSDKLNNE